MGVSECSVLVVAVTVTAVGGDQGVGGNRDWQDSCFIFVFNDFAAEYNFFLKIFS